MSGFTKAALLYGLLGLVAGPVLVNLGLALCAPLVAVAAGLATGYTGALFDRPEPSKTALVARRGASAGIVVAATLLLGLIAGHLLLSAQSGDWLLPLCSGAIGLALGGFFGWLGGWSWARHEHERQTGYKPT